MWNLKIKLNRTPVEHSRGHQRVNGWLGEIDEGN